MIRTSLLPLLAVMLLSGCRGRKAEPETRVEAPKVTLVAVGDILMHQDVQMAAKEQGGFEFLWREVRPLFDRADLVFGNLESPIAPLMGRPGEPYLFNAPAELADGLRTGGFTVLSTANNHAYDQGVRGFLETRSRLEVAGLVAIGGGRDRLYAESPRILECDGIRIAFLAWTDIFNRNYNHERKGPWVNSLKEGDASRMVKAARAQADAVVVSLHWGKEGRHDPTPRQREVAAGLLEAGADLILGHHPHVLQPLDVSEVGGRRVAVAYSLGNFISNQDRVYDAGKMRLVRGDERDGAAVVAVFTRGPSGRVGLDTIGYVPLWTENNWRDMTAGRAKVRDIRVVRLDQPARQTEPWIRRRERVRGIMGQALEIQAP